jgi:aspartate kinase
METVVQKFGGTSLGSIEKIKNVAKKICKRKAQGFNVVVVVSAMGKTTDDLIRLSHQISIHPKDIDLDLLMSAGEQISAALVSIALKEQGCESIGLTGFQAGIITSNKHTKARIENIKIDNIEKELGKGKVVVVAGFQGIADDGTITTLGRGGSDTTAVAIAAKLNSTCEIYTDVDGIYTTDPRLFSSAKKLDYISYEEMLEMSSLGAGVMHSRSIELAQKYKIPIYVASSEMKNQGTYIKEQDCKMEERAVTGLSVNDDDIMITIGNFPYNPKLISDVFMKLANEEINVDMISQTAPQNNNISISFTAPASDLHLVENIMEEYSEKYTLEVGIDTNITKISVVGIGMRSQSGVAASIFKVFSDNDIQYKQVTTSEIRITFTIDRINKSKAVTLLAEQFNL